MTEKHLQINRGDNSLEVMLLENGELEIKINNPWAGSSDTGFKRETSIDLKPEQLSMLRNFLNQLPDDEMEKLRRLAHLGLPNDCVRGYDEVKFCDIRNGDGNACKQCSNYNR